MKKGLIGVQMSTIAPAKMPSFDAFDAMKKLTDIGYHCIEISQVPMTPENVAGFRKSIDELGMNVSSCTASVAPMVPGMPGEYLNNPDDFKKIVEDCRKLDCDMLRIGMLPMTCMGSYEKAMDFAKGGGRDRRQAEGRGHRSVLPQPPCGVRTLQRQVSAGHHQGQHQNLGFELDIHWIHRGGENPVEFIKKYAGRIRLLHLKDYRIGEMKMPEGGIDFTNRESIMKFMGGFNNVVQFARGGRGYAARGRLHRGGPGRRQ